MHLSTINVIFVDVMIYLSLILESTMELFDISYFDIYSHKKANSLIKDKFKDIKSDNIDTLQALIAEIKASKKFSDNIELLKETLKNIDKLQIVKFIVDNLNSDSNERPILMLLLICVPELFFNAVYIKTIL